MLPMLPSCGREGWNNRKERRGERKEMKGKREERGRRELRKWKGSYVPTEVFKSRHLRRSQIICQTPTALQPSPVSFRVNSK